MSKTIVIYAKFYHDVACQKLLVCQCFTELSKNNTGTVFLRHSVHSRLMIWTCLLIILYLYSVLWGFVYVCFVMQELYIQIWNLQILFWPTALWSWLTLALRKQSSLTELVSHVTRLLGHLIIWVQRQLATWVVELICLAAANQTLRYLAS